MGRKLLAIFRFLTHRSKDERDLDRELRYHVDRQTELNVQRGMDTQEAHRQAVLSVGGIEPLKEECRDARAGRTVEALLQDIRYGVRVLLKNPGFSAAAVLTLALGIGANTAIFSVVYGVLLRPLPYRDGAQLVVLHQQLKQAQIDDMPFSVKEINDYCDRNHTLTGIVEHHTMNFLLIGKDTAERVETAVVSANFFDVLGVKPILGRTFVMADDRKDAPAVLILSYKYWQTHQSGDPNIIGKVFQMNNRPHTVLGVLPPIPQYPSESDVYMPTSQCPSRSSPAFIQDRNSRMMTAFARLKPGTPLDKAQADLSVAASQMVAANPDVYPSKYGYQMAVAPLQNELTQKGRTAFLVLLAGAGFEASATPLRILAAAALFAGISAIMRFAATALHVPGKTLRVDVIGVSAALVAHAVLIPTYGIIGAAVGKLCGDVVTSVGALLVLRKQFTSAIFNSLLVAVAAGIALFGALSFADYNGLNWMIAIAVCLPTIGAVLFLVPHVRQELRCLAA